MNARLATMCLAALVSAWVAARPALGDPPCEQVEFDAARVVLGDDGFDAAFDRDRNRVYVSVPDLHQIVIISAVTREIIERIPVTGSPAKISLSIDNTRLFIALDGTGTVGVMDLETNQITSIDLLAALGTHRTHDVLEALPNRLFVVGSPGGGGFSSLVMVKLDEANAWVRVANQKTFRNDPRLFVSPDRSFLLLAEDNSFQPLHKLDLADPTVPIVLSAANDSVSGTSVLAFGQDSSFVVLFSGEFVRTSDFSIFRDVQWGYPTFRPHSTTLFMAQPPYFLYTIDAADSEVVELRRIPFGFQTIRRLIYDETKNEWIILADSALSFHRLPVFDDCNGNHVRDDCEIEHGLASDVDADGALDECHCPTDSGAPVDVCAAAMTCTPLGPSTHHLRLAITNNTGAVAHWAMIVPDGSSIVREPILPLETALLDGRTGALPTFDIDGAEAGLTEFSVVLLDEDSVIIGEADFTLDSPSCCGLITHPQIACVPSDPELRTLSFELTNVSDAPLYRVLASSPSAAVDILTYTVVLSPHLDPGQSRVVELSLRTTVEDETEADIQLKLDDQYFGGGCTIDLTLDLGSCAPCPGDVSHDGRVDVIDFAMLARDWGAPVLPEQSGDCNGDGRVDTVDFNLLALAFGTDCP